MHIIQHWLDAATQVASPNFDDRSDPDDLSLVVIHCISLPPAEFGNDCINQLFCNQLDASAHPYFAEIHQMTVSAHVLIKRDGDIIQYVPFNKRAWHAGISNYQGREKCNDFSIGIELEGIETLPYTEVQYTQLAQVIQTLLQNYPTLSRQAIAGHSDIAPSRKTDPGPLFAWDKLHELLSQFASDSLFK
ncbi:MAG: 1,6-anhydro-N-acetylmuramyl-L-alanine amidase AmpD, partial [Methylococcaceae bacterium]|nr:1,6-anhydro-N-acetylmuramyl-L-alanine amidase AmpD [Methylococcaceae bacterium]